MKFLAQPATYQEILPWRDVFRGRMNCQIVHDSLHGREGWTLPYFLEADGRTAGYGSVAIGGPWKGTRTVFEFFELPDQECRAFDFFERFLAASEATAFEIQSNDLLLTAMIHAYARDIKSEKIVFADRVTTSHALEGFTFRKQTDAEGGEYVLELDGTQAARGGVLFHYNRPYGDVYMEVAEPFRRRGLGRYLVQELKRICYQMGSVPCARCNTENVASRKTLQKAGFAPCAHILIGSI
jgi:GNAT superfamily N-acetyltransferase